MNEQPNYLIIISDCTRPDKLSCYGYQRRTTPNIDRIAQEGVIFENAITQGVWTLPAHATLFTGLYPSEHGLLSATETLKIRLNSKISVIPEQLRQCGYITAGISNNPWVGQLSGLDRGFDLFMESDGSIKCDIQIQIQVPPIVSVINKIQSSIGTFSSKLLIPYLVKRSIFTEFSVNIAKKIINYAEKNNKNFFIFMNLMDTHQPYYPPRKFFKDVVGTSKYIFSVYANYKIRRFYKGKEVGEVTKILNDYYDASLRYQDHQLGNLFAYMRKKNILDKTMIIFTADHGKNLGEYDVNDQLSFLKDGILKIPFIVRYPKLLPIGKKIKNHIQLVDINYTIRELIGEKKLHPNDVSIMDIINGEDRKYAYVEAELPINIMEGNFNRNEKDTIKAVVSYGEKLIKSQKKGLLYSRSTINLKDEKFYPVDTQEHVKLLRFLKMSEKICLQRIRAKKERERIITAIKKLKFKV